MIESQPATEAPTNVETCVTAPTITCVEASGNVTVDPLQTDIFCVELTDGEMVTFVVTIESHPLTDAPTNVETCDTGPPITCVDPSGNVTVDPLQTDKFCVEVEFGSNTIFVVTIESQPATEAPTNVETCVTGPPITCVDPSGNV